MGPPFPTPFPTSFTSSHLIYFPAHLIFLLLLDPPPIFFPLSSLSLSTFWLDSSRHQTFTSLATRPRLQIEVSGDLQLVGKRATARLSGVIEGGSLEFKGEWDLGALGRSDEVNGSAETDSRQNQVSVQIPACSDPSILVCLETSKTFRNSKSLRCCAISLFPYSLFDIHVYTHFSIHKMTIDYIQHVLQTPTLANNIT